MMFEKYEREPLIIDTGTTTKRQRRVLGKPDIWKIIYGKPCTYILKLVRSRDRACCFFLGSYDLDELIEEARERGLRGVRGVV